MGGFFDLIASGGLALGGVACRVPHANESRVPHANESRVPHANESRVSEQCDRNLDTPINLDPRRLVRQTAFCDPQTLSILRFSKTVFLPAN